MTPTPAIDPARSAIVHAAAGTGKTWTLTSRIIRLLLDGAEPGGILAITFTRKAAAEMRARVRDRLAALACAQGPELRRLLAALGCANPNVALERRARGLYELLLATPQELRTTTFHAFCQELLRRFPLQSEIPPGFEVLEDTQEFVHEAWREFLTELARAPRAPAAQAMDVLLRRFASLSRARTALEDFLAHRADWWAYTEDQEHPLEFACAGYDADVGRAARTEAASETLLGDKDFRAALMIYFDALDADKNRRSKDLKRVIERALEQISDSPATTAALYGAFYFAHGGPRPPPAANKTAKTANTPWRELHEKIARRIGAAAAHDRLIEAREVNRAWLRCGLRLLDRFQELKARRRALDFVDLEWCAYRLLNRSQDAEWVQYKLDRRIDHLLIDEFQDTNPTQWRLLLPLLHEIAAGASDRRRSVFVVGDEKQSIYRFRRADPEVFRLAHDWITVAARGESITQDRSWRSSPAIMAFVNLLFDQEGSAEDAPIAADEKKLSYALTGFQTHRTHRRELPGRVELLALAPYAPPPEPGPAGALRHPLRQPRPARDPPAQRREARLIADKIRALIDGRTALGAGEGDGARPVAYGDIIILLRDRRHVRQFEGALREAGIPYTAGDQGRLSDFLEVQDLAHLLRVLESPHDDFALAAVLRSPLFGASDEDLIALARAREPASWRMRLEAFAARPSAASETLIRAQRLLTRWSVLADRVPVHDLLDRIYAEGNVIARFASAAPHPLRARVRAHLERFIALSLAVDSGRYSGIGRFLRRLRYTASGDLLTSPAADTGDVSAVRILTIHAAKGLEAPVVFLADAARAGNARLHSRAALVRWPAAAPRPTHFLFSAGTRGPVEALAPLVHEQRAAQAREEANLLYVAVTRASQFLFVSGSEPGRGGLGWYGFIQQRLRSAPRDIDGVNVELFDAGSANGDGEITENARATLRYGKLHAAVAGAPPAPATAHASDPRLYEPLNAPTPTPSLKPSAAEMDDLRLRRDAAAPARFHDERLRGRALHRLLDLLARGAPRDETLAKFRLEFSALMPGAELEECWRQACDVVDDPDLTWLFSPPAGTSAKNELTILYRDGNLRVHGVIDRLLVSEKEIVLIDYKTGVLSAAAPTAVVRERYRRQLALYAGGVARLWPGRPIRAYVLLTQRRACLEIPVGAPAGAESYSDA